jgi:hypothetical protein
LISRAHGKLQSFLSVHRQCSKVAAEYGFVDALWERALREKEEKLLSISANKIDEVTEKIA